MSLTATPEGKEVAKPIHLAVRECKPGEAIGNDGVILTWFGALEPGNYAIRVSWQFLSGSMTDVQCASPNEIVAVEFPVDPIVEYRREPDETATK
jgi:hypothetical protein